MQRGEPDVFGRRALALGDRCACCNVETKHTVGVGQVYVPCCEACRGHLAIVRRRLPRAAMLAALCVSLAVASRWFLVPAAIFAWITLTAAREPIVFTREGHFARLRVRVADGALRIGTTNPQFADTIRALNG